MNATPPSAEQLRRRENQLFLILTIVIGILAGLAAVLFSLVIELTSAALFGVDPTTGRLLLVPALMSVVTGVLLVRVFPGVRGSGVPQTEAAYHLSGGVIPARVPLGKFITGVLCIGSGHSMGREGPSVQIGAGLASVVGRWLNLSPVRVRDLVPVGAAGALAAAFNTPVAAVLFALEEIIGDMNASLIGSTVVASVSSVVVERSILGNEPLFHVPVYQLVHPAELAAYAALGVIGGAISVVFCKGLLALRGWFLRLPERTRVWQPAIGGILIGGMLIYAPGVMGVGYDYVDQALNGDLLVMTMGALCVLKMVATTISYASGNAGGIFAPSLYVGAMAGGAVGVAVNAYAPFPTADPGAYALVGMGTLFAGIIRAPMTSVFMIFEITQDYEIFVPLMVANLLSFAISKRYQPVPVYHALLRQDGIRLPSATSRPASATRAARDVMDTTAALMAPEMPVDAAWKGAAADGTQIYLVGVGRRLAGHVTRDRLAGAALSGTGTAPVSSLLEQGTVRVYPDDPLDVVLQRLAENGGVVPVVSRLDVGRVEGIITIASIVRPESPGKHSTGPTDTSRAP